MSLLLLVYCTELKNKARLCPNLFLPAGKQADIDAMAVKPSTKFSTMFKAVNATAEGQCPEGFLPANPPSPLFTQNIKGKNLYVECLKIKVSLYTFRAEAAVAAGRDLLETCFFLYGPHKVQTITTYVCVSAAWVWCLKSAVVW